MPVIAAIGGTNLMAIAIALILLLLGSALFYFLSAQFRAKMDLVPGQVCYI
jgi:hypothetical protein